MIASRQTVMGLPDPPNRFTSDAALQKVLGALLSSAALAWAEPLLTRIGGNHALDEAAALADKHPPVLHPRDRYGNRVDRIEFHPAYETLKRASYGEGIVGHYYDPQVREVLGEGREVAKFAQGYVFGQFEQGIFCPICLTDGTAFVIEQFGSREQKMQYLPRLTSRDTSTLWEGAMFLTEKAGGSDVGACEAVARPRVDGRYALHGEKWFCSNAGAQVSLVLARPEGAPHGTRGLGLFLLPRHGEDGRLNNLHLERLKDKLGTRTMPTGELILEGSVAEPVGDISRGFVQMAQMVNLSRLYNATASLAVVRRMLSEALRWCGVRETFGRPLLMYPMVRATLAELAVELEAALHLVFTIAHRRGKILVGTAEREDEHLVRLATPLAKYSTARLAVRSTSEAMELHGGNGYLEDWPIARFYRDAQVLPIWEGAGNILVLDTFRAMVKDGAHEGVFEMVRRQAQLDRGVLDALDALERALPPLLGPRPDTVRCRAWCALAVKVIQASLLLGAVNDSRSQVVADAYLLRHFRAHDPLTPPSAEHDEQHFDTLVGL
ncbi:MAG: DNA alkylation response protein [Armatimonadetes bacterium]|nr:DNA alkylation response protein [Armatimonadota bacterium]